MENGEALAKVLDYYGLYHQNQAIYKIVCPFHNDRNASMLINIPEGRYYCFGCCASGDAIKFVSEMEKSKDDLGRLKKYYSIIHSKDKQIESNVRTVKKSIQHNKKNGIAYLEAYDYYHGLKIVNWKDLKETEEFKYMFARGFTWEVLNKVKAKINYNDSYPIIFPMFDNGKFKGWVCRTNNKQVEQYRKYLYNKGFRRSNTLVGNYDVKHIPIICEGYMDRLSFVRVGCDYAVSILGWKITDEQIQKLKSKGITTVISALDNDECGIKGTEYLKKHFKVIRFPYPKEVKDAGDMNNKQIRKALRQLNYNYY